jgi:hypothetical protein
MGKAAEAGAPMIFVMIYICHDFPPGMANLAKSLVL